MMIRRMLNDINFTRGTKRLTIDDEEVMSFNLLPVLSFLANSDS